MDEILKQLLDNEMLSESTRTEISENWTKAVDAFKVQLREEVETNVRAELAEAWVSEREQLITKLDKFLGESLEKELAEFKTDVERFRDHEAEQAGKIVEMRKEMANTLATELDQLVDKLDEFLEQQIKAEFDELREDIALARQNDMGMKMFEAFRSTYETGFVDSNSVQAKLNRAKTELTEAKRVQARLEQEKAQMLRESEMNNVLRPLTGTAREQMALILKSVPTEQLAESYKRFIGRVLRESNEPAKSEPVLNESKTTIVTGDAPQTPVQKPASTLSESELTQIRRMAGIIQ